MSADLSLDQLERFVLAAISHRDGLEAGLDTPEARLAAAGRALADIIAPSASLNPPERLAIYANMYFDRLVDVLGEDYGRLRDFLGGPAFVRLARDYLHHHPSRAPNLAALGGCFPEFIADEAGDLPEHARALAADLARLERAFSRVFDAAEDRPIAASDLLDLDPARWAELRIELVSAHEILRLGHPLGAWLDQGAPAACLPEPAPSFVLVYRRDFSVFRLDLSPEQGRCLEELVAGRELIDALEAAAASAGLELDALAPRLESWFRSWTAIGLFRALVTD